MTSRVCGCRLRGGFETVFANQWEPPGKESQQFAARCYATRFPDGTLINEDIEQVLADVESGARELPTFDMLVGGFPCQDYSVMTASHGRAHGLVGKKGVLWWSIYKALEMFAPRYVLLENVDRLLASPGKKQFGRDFSIMLWCLNNLGYRVEWRVIVPSEYGMPQRRKRVFIFAERSGGNDWGSDLRARALNTGVFAEAFPCVPVDSVHEFVLPGSVDELQEGFGVGSKGTPFKSVGVMVDGRVFSMRVRAAEGYPVGALQAVRVPESEVPECRFLTDEQVTKFDFYKNRKKVERVSKAGVPYVFSMGAIPFPDSWDKPGRTILTREGGGGCVRESHVVVRESGRYSRLAPEELEGLQGFPRGWTDTGLSIMQRGFVMGNALVVPVVRRVGEVIWARHDGRV